MPPDRIVKKTYYECHDKAEPLVQAFELGYNFVIVDTCHGERIFYNEASSGIDTISTMKTLALNHAGLDDYLRRENPRPFYIGKIA